MAVFWGFGGGFLGVPLFAKAPIHSLDDYYIMFLCGYLVSNGEEVSEMVILFENKWLGNPCPEYRTFWRENCYV